MSTLQSKNPATGEVLKEIPCTTPAELPDLINQAKQAQALWAARPIKHRAQLLLDLRETLIDQAQAIATLISAENGKPHFEALTNEIIPAADTLTYLAGNAREILRDRRIHLSLMKHRKSTLNYWPLGTVAVISPWNYPFYLPLAQIAAALVAGNSVIFKPSEASPLVGLKIQELFDNSGFPRNLIQTVIGDGTLGAAIVEQKPAKVFFTGSAPTGKKIMESAAKNLTPVNLELGGKDAMIVLQDADLDFATSAALWGAYSNSGQVCSSIERLLLHESIFESFITLFKEKSARLRQGQSYQENYDLGPITVERQKATYTHQLEDALVKGAKFQTGGQFSADGKYLLPTLVTGNNIEDLEIYREESFGPILAVTSFKTVNEAIQKANASKYGLHASVITRNIGLGQQIARQLEVGSVSINETTYTAGLAETPWGGIKESGIGRTHSDIGLLEFVNIRHIHRPRSSFMVFKSPWWFPYGPHQARAFFYFLQLSRKQWLDKLRAFPHFLWNLAQFLKNEKRL